MSRFAICSISSSGPCCARMSPWLTYSGLRARRHLCRAGSCVLLPLRSAANPRGNRRRRGRGGMPWARRPSTCPASPGALPCPREAKRCGGRSRRLRPRGSRGGERLWENPPMPKPNTLLSDSLIAPRPSKLPPRALGPARVLSDFIPPTARACWGAPGWGSAVARHVRRRL